MDFPILLIPAPDAPRFDLDAKNIKAAHALLLNHGSPHFIETGWLIISFASKPFQRGTIPPFLHDYRTNGNPASRRLMRGL
jgi:hypothetical protein